MKTLNSQDRATAEAYAAANAKPYGDIHQRMKFLMEKLEEARKSDEFDKNYNELMEAIFDLETEVKFYAPRKPPYATRSLR